jgi:hypothetical protein
MLRGQELGMCVECGDTAALLTCKSCGDPFCALCFQWLHRSGSRLKHETDPPFRRSMQVRDRYTAPSISWFHLSMGHPGGDEHRDDRTSCEPY